MDKIENNIYRRCGPSTCSGKFLIFKVGYHATGIGLLNGWLAWTVLSVSHDGIQEDLYTFFSSCLCPPLCCFILDFHVIQYKAIFSATGSTRRARNPPHKYWEAIPTLSLCARSDFLSANVMLSAGRLYIV